MVVWLWLVGWGGGVVVGGGVVWSACVWWGFVGVVEFSGLNARGRCSIGGVSLGVAMLYV